MTYPFVFARGESPEAIEVDGPWRLPRPDKSGRAMTSPFVFARHGSAEAIPPSLLSLRGAASPEAISVDGCWGLPRTLQVLAMTE
jgi:hypothetical protein